MLRRAALRRARTVLLQIVVVHACRRAARRGAGALCATRTCFGVHVVLHAPVPRSRRASLAVRVQRVVCKVCGSARAVRVRKSACSARRELNW